MMTRIKTPIAVLTLTCSLLIPTGHANEALDAINSAVEQKAALIDQNYGVLLTTQERNDLKVTLVVNKLVGDTQHMTAEQITIKTQQAITTFEISDPIDQRKLVIGLEAQAREGTGFNGTEPP